MAIGEILGRADAETLKNLVTRHSLAEVVAELAAVAMEKSDYVGSYVRDSSLAIKWGRSAERLAVTALAIKRLFERAR